ncbi:MAG: hypothetical protein J5727_02995 [Kiritimatiellae bacterium]|nr:hypothetical protein [Kiritimatiellia bacterium]
MRLAVVGCEASGKTVFMAALSDHYSPEKANGICLVPETPATNRFARALLRQMRYLRQWPGATNPDNTVELKWTLRSSEETIANIDILEFGGETFRAAFRGDSEEESHKQAEQDLLNYLSAADSVVVLVSIKELLRDPGSVSAEEFERDTESMWVTRGLIDFVRKNLPGAGIVIGLTQADRYRGELAAAGGAAKFFASRWPTIATAAHSIPVVEVASVSATDENGNPADGYTTDGVMAAMKELARQTCGEPPEIKAALASILESGDSAITKAERYEEKLNALSRHAALVGDDERDFIREARAKLAELNELADAERAKLDKKNKRNLPKVAGPRTRRVFLLAFLLAAAIALLSQNAETVFETIKKRLPEISLTQLAQTSDSETQVAPTNEPPAQAEVPQATTTNEPPAQAEVPQATTTNEPPTAVAETKAAPTNEPPAQVEVPQVAQTNEPPAQVVAEQVASTNEPPAEVATSQTAPTNEPPAQVVITQVETPQAAATNEPPAQIETPQATNPVEPEFRIWTDHRGAKIKARWIANGEDSEHIILETAKGRKINAVLYKFSAEDRAYIQSQLDANR